MNNSQNFIVPNSFTIDELQAYVNSLRQKQSQETTVAVEPTLHPTESIPHSILKEGEIAMPAKQESTIYSHVSSPVTNALTEMGKCKVDTTPIMAPASKPCICKAKEYHRECVCANLINLSDLAKELCVSVESLYNTLHKEKILYRHRTRTGEPDTGGYFRFLFIYANFRLTSLFINTAKTDGREDEDEYLWGMKASELMITPRGKKLITAIVNYRKPTPLQLYRKLFPRK